MFKSVEIDARAVMSDELLKVSMNCAKENSSSRVIRRALENCGFSAADSTIEGTGDFSRILGEAREDMAAKDWLLVVEGLGPGVPFIQGALH